MKLLELSPYLIIGVDWIDQVHARLIDQVNGLATMPDDADPARFNELFGAFVDTFERHCEDEIKLLGNAGYADTKEHARAHRALVAEMRSLQAECAETPFAGMTREAFYHRNVFLFLEDAVKNDLKAKSFLVEKGIAHAGR